MQEQVAVTNSQEQANERRRILIHPNLVNNNNSNSNLIDIEIPPKYEELQLPPNYEE